MRPASSMSNAGNVGARRLKTDLRVAEPSGRSSSPAPSLRSQRAKQYRASLPVRTARLLQRSRTQTPSDAGISDGSTSPAPAPSSLLQDVVDIKTLLLQLKRVLQEVSKYSLMHEAHCRLFI
ncbi:jg10058 [Pararge aegeria aegeria]|uniref:Jg10058 protein n=1 Tax=Pararge aegeria aegeria TaxID=348720 RepID=A0A8S4SI72_9NEOP|nr:jg10058 [Pararge aegeria aegeria]